jgi:hypothetical protein
MTFRQAHSARRFSRALIGIQVISTCLLVACAQGQAPPRAEPSAEKTHLSAPLKELPLAELVPPFQPEFVVHLFPQAIFETPSLAPLREEWLGAARRTAFTAVTGVELTRLSEVWIASYGLGTLYLTPKAGTEGAQDAFLSHSQSPIARATHHTQLRLWDGKRDGTPSALVLGPYFTAFSSGDPSLHKFIVARARGALGRVPSSTEALTLLRREGPDTLASFFFAGPLSWDEELPPTSAFMDALLSIEADIRSQEDGLTLEMSFIGAWGEPHEAEEHAELWRRALLERPEMRALGLSALKWPKISCADQTGLNHCQLLMNLDPGPLCEAWKRLTLSDLSSY